VERAGSATRLADGDLHAQLGLVLLDEGVHHLRLVVDGKHNLGDARVAKRLDLVHNHRLSARARALTRQLPRARRGRDEGAAPERGRAARLVGKVHKRLGDRQRQRPQARAEAADQDEALHGSGAREGTGGVKKSE
jgi:hypothetical protein